MQYKNSISGLRSLLIHGRFYIISSPAHRNLPNKLVSLKDAASLTLGSPEPANERTIYMFVHPEVMEGCQLGMGYTMFHGGSVWNTIPAHLQDRCMEAYLYLIWQRTTESFTSWVSRMKPGTLL